MDFAAWTEASPIAGWCSERFNSRTPTSVLTLDEVEVAFPARRELRFSLEAPVDGAFR